jgi:ribonucleoside-diphosphate reductase alpha chain|tara:strand:- start:639 stop:2567 length:1929 start_codon:yes stop_codon:yes gene_type:complete
MNEINLPTDYQSFIHISRYARWIEDFNRRETWNETVDRYFDYMETHLSKKYNYKLSTELRSKLQNAVLNLEIMPSMRALMTAGIALERCHVAGYNCSYLPVDNIRSFDECLYILMCGTGVGFSVESKYTKQLPVVNEKLIESDTTIIVGDSKTGWAKAYRELIHLLYAGTIPTWDLSKLRPAGARLKTFGGRSSGPDPLDDLFQFTVGIFKNAVGRKLKPIECHDIMCKIGSVVVVGGVRRSALISLSDLNDQEMALAKSGEWWNTQGQRALANNSVCYKEKPPIGIFMREWLNLYNSKSGERGIYNRQSAVSKSLENGRRDTEHEFGTNPCSEIILRPYQFCNLTEVVVRSDDTLASLKRKVEYATILGTFQSTLTDLKYLRKIWRDNTEQERLLGVSLTGIMDSELLNDATDTGLEKRLQELRQVAVDTNLGLSDALGIEQSTAITCVKPSGTVSQLVNSASGIHARHSNYYIRTVRGDKKDPLTQFLIDQNIPCEDDVMQPDNTTVFSFPVESPEKAVTRNDTSALAQLDLWLVYQKHWCEHKPSVTITVKEDEWLDVGAWVYNNFDNVAGISFLPHTDHTYKQAPYQECSKKDYLSLAKNMPDNIDWSLLSEYEVEDSTRGGQELACTADACEIVDIT